MTAKRGRPPSGRPWKTWKDKRKTCKVCQESKHPNDFPYKIGGTYQCGTTCKECSTEEQPKGEIIGSAYIPRGERLPASHPVFKPTRIREHDLDQLAQHILNNEGQIVDFEE